ncbi:MAG: hypothetical protein Q9162_002562 [Coniocarpon cinnabarinum]
MLEKCATDTGRRWNIQRVKAGLYGADGFHKDDSRKDLHWQQKCRDARLNPDGQKTLNLLLEKWRRVLRIASQKERLGKGFDFGSEWLWKQIEHIIRDEHVAKSPKGMRSLTDDALTMFAALKRAKTGQRRRAQEWAFDKILVLFQIDETTTRLADEVLKWRQSGLKINPNTVAGNTGEQPDPWDIDGLYGIWDGRLPGHRSIKESFERQQVPHDRGNPLSNERLDRSAENWKVEDFEQTYVSSNITNMYLYGAYGYHPIFVPPNRKAQPIQSTGYLKKYNVGQYCPSLSDLSSWSPPPLIDGNELRNRYRQFLRESRAGPLGGDQIKATLQKLEQ